MKTNDEVFNQIKWLKEGQLYYDLIYTPWDTKMMKVARNNGAKVLNGAKMLASQGALAFEHFFNHSVDENVMFDLLKRSSGE